jgi:hypothetical protein
LLHWAAPHRHGTESHNRKGCGFILFYDHIVRNHSNMKREFPALYKVASVSIATPLVGLATLLYLQNGITEPSSSAFPIGITAVGVTLGLAAACFTMSPIGVNTHGQYAGEKFLHSSLLLIQSLFLLYVRDALKELDWIKTNGFIVETIKIVANAILALITATAGWSWHWGFSLVNQVLWDNWKRRIEAAQ